jgi:hypothetical protein
MESCSNQKSVKQIKICFIFEILQSSCPLPFARGEQAVVQVVVVLDNLFGLAVTSGAVGVLEGR